MSKNKFLSSRKLKYGSMAVAFTAVFIAVIILFNFIFTALDDKYNFNIDITSTNIYEISDTTRTLLAKLDAPVTINFMLPKDKLTETNTSNAVVKCAENYEREFDNVKVVYHDIIKDPSEYEKLNYYTELGYDITTTTIVVESELGFKLFSVESCFVTAESTQQYYGFKGEARITSSILTVTAKDKTVVTFTTNHGESNAPQLEEMYEYAGFDIKHIDLSQEEIDPATEILVINDPVKDFSGIYTTEEGKKTEIDKLADYLDSFKDIVLFVNPKTPVLPELEGLMGEWGMGIKHASLISDAKSSTTNDIRELIATYAGEAYGYGLHSTASDIENPLKTIVYYATPIEILFKEKKSTRKVDPVLTSSENSYITNGNDEQIPGVYNLMVLSSRYDSVDGAQMYSHFLVCGTTQFANTDYIGTSSYGNSNILYSSIQLMANKSVSVDIDWRKLDDTTLTVDANTAKIFTYVSCGVIPFIIIILGLIVWLRRRHL